jgi:hypothetical protein
VRRRTATFYHHDLNPPEAAKKKSKRPLACNPAKIQASVMPCSPTSRSLVFFVVREISPRKTQRFDCGPARRIQHQQFLTENQPCYFCCDHD